MIRPSTASRHSSNPLTLPAGHSNVTAPTKATRYLVGGPGWSGAGPAAVGMMSRPCP